jgi:hypothetical protein
MRNLILSVLLAVIAGILFLFVQGCQLTTSTTNITTSTSMTLPLRSYTLTELKYILLAYYPDLFWCDPDYYPIGSAEKEQQNALIQYSNIRSNQEEFSVILYHLNLPDQADYTDEEKLLIYRQHKKLTLGLQITLNDFTLRIGRGQGYRISGTISSSGVINVSTSEESTNTCPICLAEGTLIDTPAGPMPVEVVKVGMTVWTANESGQRIESTVARISSTIVPIPFEMISVKLSDGRTITTSPGHPSISGKRIDEYATSDVLDGALVISTEMVLYGNGATYDILPLGSTGYYWANGILLGSTLK